MSTSAAYEMYHRAVQSWIWAEGWTNLRPAQEKSAPLILEGERDVLIAAGTGQGKTEAAFFPIWSRVVDEPGPGVRVLYVAPLKALINDQRRRQEAFCDKNRIRVTPWHGDVSANKKRKLVKDPAGILLITPESLESILVRHGQGARRIFQDLAYVVVDEVHAFFGTERGRQLQSLLGRVETLVDRSIPRIGLSATLGDDREAAQEFLRPGGGEDVAIVESGDDGKDLQLVCHGFLEPTSPHDQDEDDKDLAMFAIRDKLYRTLRDGQRHLVFANRRDHVERLADLLRRRAEQEHVPNEFFPHHGSLSKELRESVEHRLKDAAMPPTVVVCTSTLEMGIDIGQMTSVAQVGCPPSVASLRQRLGRSGRGEDEPHILRLFVRESELDSRASVSDRLRVELLQTTAMVELIVRDRWCEPPEESRPHFSTLVQQTMALLVQNGGARAQDAWKTLCARGPFRAVDAREFGELLRAMAGKDLIFQMSDGSLVLTEKGEKIANHYSFYVVFQTGEEYRLLCRGKTIGHLPVVEPLAAGAYLIFAGRRWRILRVDDDKKVVELAPDRGGRPPRFDGKGGALVHDRVRQRMRQLLEAGETPRYLDARAKSLFEEGCTAYRELGLAERPMLARGPHTLWFPWVGDRKVHALALLCRHRDLKVSHNGVCLEFDGITPERLREVFADVLSDEVPGTTELLAPVHSLDTEKYDAMVPRSLLERDYAARFLDVRGAMRTMEKVVASL